MFQNFGSLARQKKVMALAFQQSYLKGKLEGFSDARNYNKENFAKLLNSLEKELVKVTEELDLMKAKIRS